MNCPKCGMPEEYPGVYVGQSQYFCCGSSIENGLCRVETQSDACKRIAELVEVNKELNNLCNEMMPYIEKWAMEKYRFAQDLNRIEKQ